MNGGKKRTKIEEGGKGFNGLRNRAGGKTGGKSRDLRVRWKEGSGVVDRNLGSVLRNHHQPFLNLPSPPHPLDVSHG